MWSVQVRLLNFLRWCRWWLFVLNSLSLLPSWLIWMLGLHLVSHSSLIRSWLRFWVTHCWRTVLRWGLCSVSHLTSLWVILTVSTTLWWRTRWFWLVSSSFSLGLMSPWMRFKMQGLALSLLYKSFWRRSKSQSMKFQFKMKLKKNPS